MPKVRLRLRIKELSRKPRVKAVTWVLLTAFSKIYLRNRRENFFKIFSFLIKRGDPYFHQVAKKVSIRKKPTTLQQNREKVWMPCGEPERLCLLHSKV